MFFPTDSLFTQDREDINPFIDNRLMYGEKINLIPYTAPQNFGSDFYFDGKTSRKKITNFGSYSGVLSSSYLPQLQK